MKDEYIKPSAQVPFIWCGKSQEKSDASKLHMYLPTGQLLVVPVSHLSQGSPLWSFPAWRRDKGRVGRVRLLPGELFPCWRCFCQARWQIGTEHSQSLWVDFQQQVVVANQKGERAALTPKLMNRWHGVNPSKTKTHRHCPVRHPSQHQWGVESPELWGSV